MTRAMNHGDDLNRFLLPGVANHVRVEIPEAISAIQEFFVKVADTRRLSQGLQRFIISGSETFSGIGAIRCDIQEDLRQVGPCFWRKPKPPFSHSSSLLLYASAFRDQSAQFFEHLVSIEQIAALGLSSAALQLGFQLL